jgi:RNA-directed DNA polymerase
MTSRPGRLFVLLTDTAVLASAWERTRSKRSAGGADDVSVEAFEREPGRELARLRAELLDGSFMPRPALRVPIPKDGGAGVRVLGLPAVRDKIV